MREKLRKKKRKRRRMRKREKEKLDKERWERKEKSVDLPAGLLRPFIPITAFLMREAGARTSSLQG